MCVPLPLSLSLCSLRPIDVEFMQRMHNCVNIIPVIGKADTLTVEEREAFKARVSGGGEPLPLPGIIITSFPCLGAVLSCVFNCL